MAVGDVVTGPSIGVVGDYLVASLSAAQTSNLAVNDHIEFDETATKGSAITASTGSGQDLGKFTLVSGLTYRITWRVGTRFTPTGTSDSVAVQLYDSTGGTQIDGDRDAANPGALVYTPHSTAVTFSAMPVQTLYHTTTASQTVEFRFTTVTGNFERVHTITHAEIVVVA